jgi:hypothetical protein
MHGPDECMGDIIELCAANQYPDPYVYPYRHDFLERMIPAGVGHGILTR